MTDFTTEDGEPQFTTSRVRRGYAPEEVDSFLNRVAEAVRTGGPVPALEDVRFHCCFGGYDQEEVDIFLDDLMTELHQV